MCSLWHMAYCGRSRTSRIFSSFYWLVTVKNMELSENLQFTQSAILWMRSTGITRKQLEWPSLGIARTERSVSSIGNHPSRKVPAKASTLSFPPPLSCDVHCSWPKHDFRAWQTRVRIASIPTPLWLTLFQWLVSLSFMPKRSTTSH